MRFTAAYAAAPVCSPTRAALLTGQAPARLQLTTFLPGRGDAPSQLLLQAPIVPHLPLTATTLAERLGARGYRSAYIGKWHLGGAGFLPTDQGFDTYFAGTADTQPTADEGGKGEYALTAEAEKFVAANRERPFFLYLAHNCPHIPLAAQPDLIAKHAGAYNPTYAAMIETLDDSVGRLVDQLDKLGLAEQTLIIFTSDNGRPACAGRAQHAGNSQHTISGRQGFLLRRRPAGAARRALAQARAGRSNQCHACH